jgi:hypothetical protein
MKNIAQWTDEQIENSLRTPDDERNSSSPNMERGTFRGNMQYNQDRQVLRIEA